MTVVAVTVVEGFSEDGHVELQREHRQKVVGFLRDKGWTLEEFR